MSTSTPTSPKRRGRPPNTEPSSANNSILDAALQKTVQASLAAVRASNADLALALELLMQQFTVISLAAPIATLKTALARIEDEADRACDALQRLTSEKRSRQQSVRHMQVQHGIYRPARIPDPMNTIILCVVLILLESCITAAMLVSDGRVEPMAGLAYGLMFALVNVLLGLVAGFFGLRYLRYGLGGTLVDDSSAIRMRKLAAIGLIAAAIALSQLLFAAMRLRAVGTHHDVYVFSEVGFWATVNDGVSIIILVIGIISGLLSSWKGWVGLADPVPGYGEAWIEATDDIDALAEDVEADAQVSIKDLRHEAATEADEALEDAEEQPAEYREMLADYARDVAEHNNNIDAAKASLSIKAQETALTTHYVAKGEGRAAALPALDLSAFDALRIEPPARDGTSAGDNADIETLKTLLADLTATHDRAAADIRAALAAYRADTPDLGALMATSRFKEGDAA